MIRKPLIVVLVMGQIIAMLVAANLILETPLSTPPGSAAANYIRARQLSEPALAGMQSFDNHCASCHGEDAVGTDQAPSLRDRAYAKDFRDSRLFHEEVAQDIPAHRDILQAGQDGGALDFNRVEMMSKYLREMRRRELQDQDG